MEYLNRSALVSLIFPFHDLVLPISASSHTEYDFRFLVRRKLLETMKKPQKENKKSIQDTHLCSVLTACSKVKRFKVRDKFSHIRDYKAFKVLTTLDPKTILKHQLAVAFFDASGQCISVTCLQPPGVIDELFSYTGPLGAIFSNELVSLFLWAPTAQEVRALIYSGSSGDEAREVVQLKECDDVWSVNGPKSWEGCYYVYEVSVYHPTTLKIEKCIANDPYARGLSGEEMEKNIVKFISNWIKDKFSCTNSVV